MRLTDPLKFVTALAALCYWHEALADARACDDDTHAREAVQMIEEYALIVADIVASSSD
jgi:hypothetical protein